MTYEMKPKPKSDNPKPNSPSLNDGGGRGDTYKKVTWDDIYNPPPSPGPSGLS